MRNEFISELSSLCPFLDDESISKMADYYEQLVKTNEKLNLTAITAPKEAAQKHFADSVSAKDLIPQKAHVLDVGTGGGFPGVPLKIAREDIKLTMIDSVGKKTEAVADMIKNAGIEAEVFCTRAEEFDRRGQFDAVVSRAVAALPVLLELCVPLVRLGGIFIAYKQADAEDIKHTQKAQKELGCVLAKKIPLDDKVLLVFEKTAKTPPQYPRRYAKIKSKPL